MPKRELDGQRGSSGAGCADDPGATCAAFAAEGECAKNGDFMLQRCPRACGMCSVSGDRARSAMFGVRKLVGDDDAAAAKRRADSERIVSALLARQALQQHAAELARRAGSSGRCLFYGARLQYQRQGGSVEPGTPPCDERLRGCEDELCAAVELDEGPPLAGQCTRGHAAAAPAAPASGSFSSGIGLANFGVQMRCAHTLATPLVAIGRACSPCLASLHGAVALVERGVCNFVDKVSAAAASGASLALIYDPMAANEDGYFAMQGVVANLSIPVLSVPRLVGEELLAAIRTSGGSTNLCNGDNHVAPELRSNVLVSIDGMEMFLDTSSRGSTDLLSRIDNGYEVLRETAG